MGESECIRDVAEDADGVGDRKRAFPLQPGANRLALHKRHYIVEKPVRRPGIVDRQDVGVLQVGGGANLARESVDAERFRKLRTKDLDRDWAIVPQVAREIDSRRTALTELALDAIAVFQGTAKSGENGVGQRSYTWTGVIRALKVRARLIRGNRFRTDPGLRRFGQSIEANVLDVVGVAPEAKDVVGADVHRLETRWHRHTA